MSTTVRFGVCAVAVVMAAGSAMALTAVAPAQATPARGTTVVVLSDQIVHGRHYVVSEITVAPDGSTAGTPTAG